jgi:uncharacterized protein YceK
MQPFRSKVIAYLLSVTLLLSGCTSTLVRDDVKRMVGVEGIVLGANGRTTHHLRYCRYRSLPSLCRISISTQSPVSHI